MCRCLSSGVAVCVGVLGSRVTVCDLVAVFAFGVACLCRCSEIVMMFLYRVGV